MLYLICSYIVNKFVFGYFLIRLCVSLSRVMFGTALKYFALL